MQGPSDFGITPFQGPFVDTPPEDRPCNCDHPTKWVADSHFPVEFDEEMNEYYLVRDGARAVMRYCFWCGGRLPESTRGTFFTTPDQDEMNEIHSLLTNARALEDVFRILGPPDETLDLGGGQYGPGMAVSWKRIHRYSTRWKSLILDFPDLPDGHRHSIIRGQHLGNPEVDDLKLGNAPL